MNMASAIGSLASGIVSPITNLLGKKEERRKAVEVIKATTAQGETEGETSVKLSNAQWELISKKSETDTWKDEYITIIITYPLIAIFVGSVMSVFLGDERLLIATTESLDALQQLGLDLGELMLYTVLAGLGIKLVK